MKSLFIILSLFVSTAFYSQEQVDTTQEEIFITPEVQPEFPGGQSEMYKFFTDSIQYPRIETEDVMIGKTFVSFNIATDGSIQDIEVVKSCGYSPLDEEAVRVISIMPKWEPGRIANKPVKVKYTIPFGWHLD